MRTCAVKKNLLSLVKLSLVIFSTTLVLYSCNLFSNEEKDPEPKEALVPITISFHNQVFSIPIGDELQMHYTISPDTAMVTDLIWTSSNNAAVEVSQSGLIRAVGIGSAEIKLSSVKRNAQASAMISVVPIPLNSVAMEHEVFPAYINEAKNLPLTFFPDNATDKTVTWESSDSGIVSVNEAGNITAKKLGYAWVTVRHSNSIFDNAVIVPATKGQLMAANQVNESGTKHYLNVYVAALEKITVVKQVTLYLGVKGDPNASELKTVSPNVTLAAGQGEEIKIEVNAEEANQLTFGRYVRIDASIGGDDYYVYVSWMNNIEFMEK